MARADCGACAAVITAHRRRGGVTGEPSGVRCPERRGVREERAKESGHQAPNTDQHIPRERVSEVDRVFVDSYDKKPLEKEAAASILENVRY